MGERPVQGLYAADSGRLEFTTLRLHGIDLPTTPPRPMV